jgi:hypothetical protein
MNSAAAGFGRAEARKAFFIPTHIPSRTVSPTTRSNRTRPFYSTEYKQFVLPYEAARTDEDPDHAVARFLQTTYEAAATLGGWDRAALEADPNRLPPQSARRTSFGSASPRQRGASS